MDRFSKYNPKVTFLFFILIIVFTLSFFNPFTLSVSLICAILYKFKLDGKKTFSYLMKFIFPLIILVCVFNFIFVHYGATVLFTVNDTVFTFESLFYGLCQGIMFAGVIVWFSCYNAVVTSERFLSVFGKFAPNLALIFSMVLSFIPRMKKNANEISESRMQINYEKSKFKKSISNFSALITMTLEECIEVSDSMKARGFGKGRTVYSKYKFSAHDGVCTALLVIFAASLIIFKAMGLTDFLFDPVIIMEGFSPLSLLVFMLFALLPLIIDFTEDIRWYCLKRKI